MQNTQETLYIRILIWSYYYQENGFYWGELIEKFNLTTEQELWVRKIFMPSNTLEGKSDNLIDHLSYNSGLNKHKYVITAKGTSVAIDYLNLKEAQKSGIRAERIAIVAIITSVSVGLLQIIIELIKWLC